MTENEELLVQILQAYDDGNIDFSKVPDIQTIVRRETARQVAQQVGAEEIRNQASQQFKADRQVYNQQVNEILKKQATRLQQQTNQLDMSQLKQQLLAEIEHQGRDVKRAQAKLEQSQVEFAKREANQFWKNLIPTLAGMVVSLFFALMIVLLFKSLLWDGVWHGLGLNRLTEFVLTLAKSHPFGGGVLGLILLILVVMAIIVSFWSMVRAVKLLTDWDTDKLMFWRDWY